MSTLSESAPSFTRCGGTDADPLFRCEVCTRAGFSRKGLKAHVCRPDPTAVGKGNTLPSEPKNSARENKGFSRVLPADPAKSDPNQTLLPGAKPAPTTQENRVKSKKPYEILRQDTRNPAKLTRHPEAETPISDDDLAALAESVRERGLIDPILINEQDQVVDGCSRLEAALRAGLAEVPVTVVYCEDVRALACDSLIGRMRSKGQRVLAWVLKQGDQASIAWNIRRQVNYLSDIKSVRGAEENTAKKLYPELKAAEVARLLEQFSADAVAARLGASKDYADSALQLVGCLKLKLKVSGGGAEKIRYTPLKEGSKADALYLTQLELAVENILRGDAQVTRWRAGVGGATATKEVRRAEVNVGDLVVRSATSLKKTVWGNWAKLPKEDQDSCTQALTEAFETCPVEVAKALLETLGNVVAVEDQE